MVKVSSGAIIHEHFEQIHRCCSNQHLGGGNPITEASALSSASHAARRVACAPHPVPVALVGEAIGDLGFLSIRCWYTLVGVHHSSTYLEVRYHPDGS